MFQKLREAALAYHLTRKWSKQKILTQYLNSVYFGNGAYGDRVRRAHVLRRRPDTGLRHAGSALCASELSPHEAALLAGIIASPERATTRSRTPAADGAAQPGARARCSSRA